MTKSIHLKIGEWYWGAECPTCHQMTAFMHDESKGQADVEIEAAPGKQPLVELVCPSGHKFTVSPAQLKRFAWNPS